MRRPGGRPAGPTADRLDSNPHRSYSFHGQAFGATETHRTAVPSLPAAASRRRILGLALGAVVLPAASRGATGVAEIVRPIEALDAAILSIWRAGAAVPFPDRYRQVEAAVTAALDLAGIIEASVGPRWARLRAEDRAALLAAFVRFTIASYVAGFARYAGQTFEIDPEPAVSGAYRLVQTRILRPGAGTTRLDYLMHPVPDGWKAADVLLAGTISRVSVQRSDFRALLDDASAARLIDSLRRRTTDLSGGTL